MTEDAAANLDESDLLLTHEEAGWIESIRAARLRVLLEEGTQGHRRSEIEEELLRALGFRAPPPLGALATPLTKRDDRDWLDRQVRLSRWLKYIEILYRPVETRSLLRQFAAGDESVNLKIEAWVAGHQLFQEIGGGRSPSHVRKTIQGWAREFESDTPNLRIRVPIPTGDPPPGVFEHE
jgi:hypothetical protein